MKKQLFRISSVLIISILFSACEKELEIPMASNIFIEYSVDKNEVTVGGSQITTGPVLDYEQDSDVIYKITVSADDPLAMFIVSTSSDAFSSQSGIIGTKPENVIDEEGNFTKDVKRVEVFYRYRIHELDIPGSEVAVTFAFQNVNSNTRSSVSTFRVLRKGSSNGNPLTIINSMWTYVAATGVGTQDGLDLIRGEGISTEGNVTMYQRVGAFFSFEYKTAFHSTKDAILNADKIELVGYRTRYNGTNPVLASNRFYLTTPSDTSILFSEYEGAGAKTVKDELLKETLLEMSTKIDQEGKNPVKGYFMRLDTITGERQVSPEYFDGLTHDNEFDELLEGIKEAGHTFAGPVRLEEVYGFVLEDGRRGLLRTSPRLITNPNRVYINSPPILTISQPDQDFYNLWFMVKMQDAL